MITLAIVGLSLYLWPARFGGSTRLVIVSGESMEPTYDLGDLVVARDGTQPDVGDVVVFAVPEGEAEGMLVIHRVLDVDSDGFFVTQGDNRDTPDQWKLTGDDIVGEPLLHIPKGALAIRFLQQWWVLMILVSLLVVVVLWPSDDDDDDRTDDHQDVDPDRTTPIPVLADAELLELPAGTDAIRPFRPTRTADPNVQTLADLDRSLALLGLDVGSWSIVDEHRVDPSDRRAMAEAEAWVDEQLAGAR